MIKIIVDSEQERADLEELFQKAVVIINQNTQISEPQKMYMTMAFDNIFKQIEVEGRR